MAEYELLGGYAVEGMTRCGFRYTFYGLTGSFPSVASVVDEPFFKKHGDSYVGNVPYTTVYSRSHRTVLRRDMRD